MYNWTACRSVARRGEGRFHPYFSLFLNCRFSKEWYHNVNTSGLVLLTINQNYSNSSKKVNHNVKSNKKTALNRTVKVF